MMDDRTKKILWVLAAVAVGILVAYLIMSVLSTHLMIVSTALLGAMAYLFKAVPSKLALLAIMLGVAEMASCFMLGGFFGTPSLAWGVAWFGGVYVSAILFGSIVLPAHVRE